MIVFASISYGKIEKPLLVPRYRDILVDQNNPIVHLKKLYDQNRFREFYEKADALLIKMSQQGDKITTSDSIKNELWMFYLISSAPFLDLELDNNIKWMSNHLDLDYEVKQKVVWRISPKDFIDNSGIKDKNGLDVSLNRELFLSYFANLLKQFREEIDLNLSTKIELLGKKAIKNDNLMNDDRARTMFMNRLTIREGRNFSAQRAVKKLEKDLMKILIWAYPTKALEVKKYIRLAGYSDEEIPYLLDRTVGRVREANYLYKGFPKRRD